MVKPEPWAAALAGVPRGSPKRDLLPTANEVCFPRIHLGEAGLGGGLMTCEEVTSPGLGAKASGLVAFEQDAALDRGAWGKKVLESTVEAGEGTEGGEQGGAHMGRGCRGLGGSSLRPRWDGGRWPRFCAAPFGLGDLWDPGAVPRAGTGGDSDADFQFNVFNRGPVSRCEQPRSPVLS